MMEVRTQLDALDAADDLVVIEERLATADEPFAIAAEGARTNGPAILFEDVPGNGRLVAGLRGGPDQMVRRDRFPRSRIAEAVGLSRTADYTTMLETLGSVEPGQDSPTERELDAEACEVDLPSLCFPRVSTSSRPVLTSGIAAVENDSGTSWAPLRGTVRDRQTVRLSVPEGFATVAAGTPVRLAVGVPTGACLAAHATAGSGRFPWDRSAPDIAAALGDVHVSRTDGPAVPASSEVVVSGTVEASDTYPDGPRARWEAAVPSASVELTVDSVATRSDPLVPVVPLDEPLADDVHVTGLVEAARLFTRVNEYWGVAPVEWVSLPVEAGLGICLVASEILYAGFEWQLANTLFSYASLFDKVFLFDADRSPDALGRAFDDIWVKAHPSRNWTFSEPEAPPPEAPRYRENGEPGARLYVNAAWDPGWDEEYIAPEVGFESTYSEEMRTAIREQWETFGFESQGD